MQPKNHENFGERLLQRLDQRYPGLDPTRYGIDISAGTKNGTHIGMSTAACEAVAGYLIEVDRQKMRELFANSPQTPDFDDVLADEPEQQAS